MSYWSGVGWGALGAGVGGAAGTLGVYFTCPFPESLYLPGALALTGSIASTIIWALASSGSREDEPGPSVSLSVSPIGEDGRGLMAGASGRF